MELYLDQYKVTPKPGQSLLDMVKEMRMEISRTLL